MTTDKERAEVMRELAAELSEPTAPWVAESHWNSSALMHKADELDPPKPTYADGLYRSARHGYYWQLEAGTWHGTSWAPGTYPADQVDRLIAIHGELVPVRVLADDEIAIQRTEDTSVECLDSLIEKLRHCVDSQHVITRSILGDIRNAAVEAGVAK